MAEQREDPQDDVLPPAVNTLFAAAWIALFAGRWIVVQLLLAAGVLSPTMVADLDDHILVRCYLLLLAVSILVAILRFMRSRKPGAESHMP